MPRKELDRLLTTAAQKIAKREEKVLTREVKACKDLRHDLEVRKGEGFIKLRSSLDVDDMLSLLERGICHAYILDRSEGVISEGYGQDIH